MSSIEDLPTVGDVAATRHQMGLWSCMSYVIANIIGAGIFITPGTVLKLALTNGMALVVWLGCGLISLIGGICYIELGTSIRDPGCDFAYNVYVGWEGIAFSFMWVGVIMSFPASAAVQAQTFGQYIVAGLSPIWHLGSPYDVILERGLGFALIIILTVLNLYAIDKYASKFQIFVTIAKLLSLAIIIVTGFWYLIVKGETEHFKDAFTPLPNEKYDIGQISLAFYGALWSFAGWDILNYGTPEIKNPRRTMPIALLGGISAVTLVYMAMNVSYMTVLDTETLKNSSAVAADFARITLGDFSYAIPFMISILLIGTLNSNIFCGSRFTHAAAREGHLPTFLSCINAESNSPRAALLFQLICTIAVTFVDTESLITYVTFVMFGQRVFTMAALLWIRYRNIPVHPDAIRVPLIFSILFFMITIALVVTPFIEDFTTTIVGVGLVLMGFLLYMIFMKPKQLPGFLYRFNDGITRVTCKILFTTPDLKHASEIETLKSDDESVVSNDERTTLSTSQIDTAAAGTAEPMTRL
ncbi:Amino acid transporter [Caenorhabditis elegans]|uniref:Amino acid transporter n=1 Tax=Caenorhabditis elegans TaxID=6239 RepID=Q56VY0_CAEEL|nr:Amino acid transporter [Caenorhabditis elegans]CAI79268.1 Amino acid transporter [Caenorhabditis elegans]|eukprot:NP_001021789.1 Amino Acid Transporter [Caenorhabditis elegans]